MQFPFAEEILAASMFPGPTRADRIEQAGQLCTRFGDITAKAMNVTEVLFRNYDKFMGLSRDGHIHE